MAEIQEALDRRQAKREKLNLAKDKREEKRETKTKLRDSWHESCQSGHTWFAVVHLDGFSRDVEICTDENLEDLAWMGKKFGWKITKKGLWSERSAGKDTQKGAG